MTEKIKSSLISSYMTWLLDWGDTSSINKEAIVKDLGFPLDELFLTQKNADYVKRLGRDVFSKAVALYFSRFQNSDGIDYVKLNKDILMHKKILLRHLGKDSVRFLTLICQILDGQPEVKKKLGLLFAMENNNGLTA